VFWDLSKHNLKKDIYPGKKHLGTLWAQEMFTNMDNCLGAQLINQCKSKNDLKIYTMYILNPNKEEHFSKGKCEPNIQPTFSP
jgi:hypothetical protein